MHGTKLHIKPHTKKHNKHKRGTKRKNQCGGGLFSSAGSDLLKIILASDQNTCAALKKSPLETYITAFLDQLNKMDIKANIRAKFSEAIRAKIMTALQGCRTVQQSSSPKQQGMARAACLMNIMAASPNLDQLLTRLVDSLFNGDGMQSSYRQQRASSFY